MASLTAQNIIEVGKRLIQAKSLVAHGKWQDWLQNNFQLSYRTAKNFIDCAEKFSNVKSIATLNSTQMIALLSLPDAAETEKFIAEKAAEGKKVADMTIKKLGVAQEVVKIKLHDAQITAEQVTFAKIKLGELLAALPTQSGARTDLKPVDTAVDRLKPKSESIAELGITQKQAERLQQMAKNPEAVQSAYDRSILALKLKPAIAAKAKENLATHTSDGYQGLQNSAKAVDTRQEIAKAAGVSDKLTCSLPHFTSEKLKPR